MTTSSKVVLTNPEMMYVIAHPLRMRILGSLRIDGPSTSAILARRLRTDSGQTSHHLRLLAKHGFVQEAPELGKGAHGRERWWKAVHDSTELSDPDACFGAGGTEALMAMERTARAVWDQAIDTFHADVAEQKWSADWQQVAFSTDHVIRTTPDRLESFRSEVARLVQECNVADQDAKDAEKVLIILHTYPHRASR